MTTTETETDGRITAMRDEQARLGNDVTSMSDCDLLLMELDRVRAESRGHENRASSLLQDRVEHDRVVRAAAKRAADGDRLAWAGLYLSHMVARSAYPINGLIHQVAELPDGRVTAEQARELKAVAQQAKWQMSGLVGHHSAQFDDVRRQSPQIQLVEKQRDEIWRLRDRVTEQGQRLHAESGPRKDEAGRCVCAGCELIRAMDDVKTPPSSEGAKTAA